LLLMITYFFVFGVVMKAKFGADPSRHGFVLYFLAGILPWLAFVEAAGRAPNAILENRVLVKKLVFPLDTVNVVQTIAGLTNQIIALAIFVVYLWIARGGIPVTALWLPALLIPQLLFTVGTAWFLAALGVYVRDLAQIIGFLLTLLFYLTPICSPESALPANMLPVLGANPIFMLVRAWRTIFLEGRPPDFTALGVLWVIGIASAAGGYAWFHKLRKGFADVL
ncbi:MAG: ABC transporter permease, partial [Bryobacteraceae bacterium]